MNSTATKKAIGVDPSIPFELDNIRVKLAFHGRGDSVRNSAGLLPELIANGVRLLVYAGVTGASVVFDSSTETSFGPNPNLILRRPCVQFHGKEKACLNCCTIKLIHRRRETKLGWSSWIACTTMSSRVASHCHGSRLSPAGLQETFAPQAVASSAQGM